ncbi:MAG: methyltransferase domain-containing protein [Sphingopyxis sp.]|nr:methyltransferase domain-containing protein [Sphingopyxis sp.]
MSIIGYLERVTSVDVAGWAFNPERPDHPVKVDVFHNDLLIASGEAREFRDDLQAAQIGTGHHAFVINIPFRDGRIDCRVEGVQLPPLPDARSDAREAGEFWDTMGAFYAQQPPRAHWPLSPHIVRDQNERACGRIIPGGSNRGAIELFKDIAGADVPVGRAVSIGCGPGHKELMLLKDGIVSHFDLYDVSNESLNAGRNLAQQMGVEDRVRFIHGYDFESDLPGGYDLVYWDNALHHMFDATAAVRWSRDALRPGGWFVMTDYVGASRFQWPAEVYDIADAVRGALPDECFHNPINPAKPYSRYVGRPTLQDMEYDPSEAADSEAILPAIDTYFPNATIRHVGGTIFHLALSEVLTNILEESDLLNSLLKRDREIDIPHYAVAVAQKPY